MTVSRGRGRPPVTSSAEIERVAVQLFLDYGYENTTIQDIVKACGISKTSFFRYFRAKSDVIWSAFDDHLTRLSGNLRRQPKDVPVIDAVIDATLETFAVDIDPAGVWLRRFRLQEEIDRGAPRSVHWMMWADVLSNFVRERTAIQDSNFVPEAIGGAIQGALLAFIRVQDPDAGWVPADTLRDFKIRLESLATGMQRWVDHATK
ncbi:MAG: TetR/AcrR family transcriptional regulator [Yaniella sp.]|uniref:TetR/AcrR family transcriptional regulator n=1 Tax=Yaniella sp. TaxID=2773929 RepID=UPI002648D870|nr:TetR/AcrR family transcriptional regulator [Yaniella sp.]MDN5731500.1 TetR/AcrR family transcriptional regulator [Yaniella sp.]MDN5742103.1 TetR/AcrR family transcriptional regulator [Yaniella sp.]MDN5815361.1 TetR/AcrR family transcriptional regulator [Yaniella sp.]MDN5817035.1 TetR/AcrR family transcriptional regulator [Yaniella sp.]MDN5838273.1 TetR/AcrR family transcriptional regulator [Yaniella sp.]